METSFEFVGDNKQLLKTIQEIKSNFEELQKVANKYGVSTEEVMKALNARMNEVGTKGAQSVVSGAEKINNSLKEVSKQADEVKKDIEGLDDVKFTITGGIAGGDWIESEQKRIEETTKKYEDQTKALDEINKKIKETLANKEARLSAEQVTTAPPTPPTPNVPPIITDSLIKDLESFKPAKATADELLNTIERINEKLIALKAHSKDEAQQVEDLTARINELTSNRNAEQSVIDRSKNEKWRKEATEAVEEYNKKIKEAEEQLKALKNQQEKTNNTIQALGKIRGKSEGQLNKLGVDNPIENVDISGISKVKQAVEQLKGSFADLGGSLGQSVRGIKMLGKGGAESVKGLSMLSAGIKGVGKALTAAFVTNPIGIVIAAIVGAIALLVKSVKQFFTGTEEGSKVFMKLKGEIDGVKAVIENFMENLGRFIVYLPQTLKKLFDNIVTNVKGIGQVFANLGKIIKGEANISDFFSWEELGVEWKGNAKAIYEARKEEGLAMEELRKKRRAWAKEEKELEAENAKLREVMYSGGKLEQMEAIAKMQDNINEKYKQELALAKEELNIKKGNLINAGVKFDKNGDVIKWQTGNASTAEIDKYYELQTNIVNLQKQQNTELSAMSRRYGAIIRAAGEYEKQQKKLLLDLQFELDKETNKGKKDAEVDNLRLRLQYATDINEQLDLENKIRERELAAEKEQLQLEEKRKKEQVNNRTKQDILTWYGQEAADEFQAAIDNNTTLTKFSKQYQNLKTGEMEDDPMGILSSNAQQNKTITDTFIEKGKNAEDKAEREKHRLELEKDINAYKDYVNEIVEAEKWRQEQLEKLEMREGNGLTREQIDKGYNDKVSMAARDKGIDGTEADIARIVSKLQADISDITFDQVQVKLQEFLNEVDNQIAQYEDENGMSYTDYQNDMTANQAIVNSEDSTEEQRAAAIAQIKADEEAISAIKAQSAEGDGVLLKLIEARKRGENMAAKAQEKAGKKSKKDLALQKKSFGAVNDAIDTVTDTAKQLADTFGNVLSGKAKKALDTLVDTGDVAKNVMNGIEMVMDASSKGIMGTSTAAAEGIKSVEKASVILAIISIAIQVVMKIVEIAKQFTKDAKLQEEIDKSKEKVEELKRSNDKLQRSYQSKVGVDYYKGLYKAAKDYDNVLREQSKSIQLAQEKYKLLAQQWGEDSDKAKEAKDQVNELKDAYDDTYDKQQEQMEQLRSELLTTDLKSFSQQLAESMVDGFSQGKDSIKDTFDEMLDDLMRQMMTKNLALAFEKQFEGVFNEMNKRVDKNGGSLSTGDIDDIMTMMETAKGKATTLAETYYDIMDEMGILTDEDEEASKGSITGLTQDQGDQLNARFTALQIEGANVVAATQAMQIALTQIGTDVTMQTSIMQSIQAQCTLGTQIAQNQLDELRVISAHTAAIEGHAARLKAIEQNTARL